MWASVTGINGGTQSYVNMDKVNEMYRHIDGKRTILEFENGNEIHVSEHPWEILSSRRVNNV